jgi:hypothetical protein
MVDPWSHRGPGGPAGRCGGRNAKLERIRYRDVHPGMGTGYYFPGSSRDIHRMGQDRMEADQTMNSKAIFLILALALLVAGVTANTYVLTNVPGTFSKNYLQFSNQNTISVDFSNGTYAIQYVMFNYPSGTSANFTLDYGNAQHVSGWVVYYPVDFLCVAGICPQSVSEIALGNSTYGYQFIDTSNVAGIWRLDLGGYAEEQNATGGIVNTGFALMDQNYNILNQQAVFYPIANLNQNTIHRLIVTSNKPMTVTVWYDKTETIAANAVQDQGTFWKQLIANAWSTITTVGSLIVSFVYWLKLIFVDDLIPIISVLGFGVVAYAANNSYDAFDFWYFVIKTGVAAYEWAIRVWYYIILILDHIKGIIERWL